MNIRVTSVRNDTVQDVVPSLDGGQVTLATLTFHLLAPAACVVHHTYSSGCKMEADCQSVCGVRAAWHSVPCSGSTAPAEHVACLDIARSCHVCPTDCCEIG